MEFVGIIGDRGSGKTCYMTKKLLESHAHGEKLVTNYTLTNTPHTFMTFEQIRKLPPELFRKRIGIDELGIGADSYDFFSKDTRKITELVAEIRKRQCQAYYTVQRFSMIARRLRLLTDGYIFMEDRDKNKPVPLGKIHRDVCDGIFRMIWCDSDLRVVRGPVLFDGRKYYSEYNTDELVRDVRTDEESKVVDKETELAGILRQLKKLQRA